MICGAPNLYGESDRCQRPVAYEGQLCGVHDPATTTLSPITLRDTLARWDAQVNALPGVGPTRSDEERKRRIRGER